MEIVLNICISDGSEILVDGFDEISFYNEVPNSEIEHSGYSWEKDYYYELLNALSTYNFIGIKRNDNKDVLDYRDHSFAFRNEQFRKNETLYLNTSTITTIIAINK